MKAMYNAGAQLSLAQLNKNINKAGNAMAKLASGQRKIGAQDDDTAGFGISEKMREQIRSLLQDNQNVQNGSSMVKIAERGIDQILEELRTLKELSINSANDSNTDEDRRTIQKEFDSRIATIDEIAVGTEYNGKILLDGRWSYGVAPVKPGSGGNNTKLSNVVGSFSAGTNATSSGVLQNGASATVTDPTTGLQIPNPWSFTGNIAYQHVVSGQPFKVELDFSAMTTKEPYPATLNGQGFTILCGDGGCEQYVNIRFDASTTATKPPDRSSNTMNGITNNRAVEYIIGVKNVKSANDLAEAIFQGIYSKNQIGNNVAQIDTNHDLKIERDASGKIFISKNGPPLLFKEGTIPNPLTDPIPDAETKEKPWNPLWVQHGTQAGQRVNIYINSMQTKDLGIENASVRTKEEAIATIALIDSAIDTALDEATNLGAWLQRLEYTDLNVTTMGENVQNAESTIRDVDMAKEITEYTKYNILTQSSQAMLAQANQNGSAILSLLQ